MHYFEIKKFKIFWVGCIAPLPGPFPSGKGTHPPHTLTPSAPTAFLPRCMQCRRGLAMRILSVRPSVTRVHCDKTVERSVQIYIPYERQFSLVY